MQYIIKEKKILPQSQFFLELEIPSEEVETHLAHVLEHLKKDTELPGFRKGFVPDKILRERVGEMALFEEATIVALSAALGEICRTEKLSVIGRPNVETTMLAPKNPAKFKVTLSLYPELTLPDYKKIAAEHNHKKLAPETVEEKEIDAVIAEITKQYKSSGGLSAMPAHTGQSGRADFVLTDETVKEFGTYETVADFRDKVKQGLGVRREELGKEKRRAEFLDKLTEQSHGEIPNVLIESELSRMESELHAEIEKMGGSFEAYLKEIKKDKESLKKEWRKDAEKRARLQLTLFQIARANTLSPSEEQIEAEVKHLLEHYKNANHENARSYIETLLTNKKVLEFLENQK